MIGGRVTEGSIHTRVLANLQRNIAKGAKIQDQLSSGKQLNRPSDSPAGTVSALQLRGETRTSMQYTRNADDGLGWLGTLEQTLGSSSTLVNRARDLTVQGLNSTTNGAQANEALATEIDQIRESLVSYANTRYLDRPVFGGNTTEPVAYDKDGGFTGNAYDPADASRTSVSPAKPSTARLAAGTSATRSPRSMRCRTVATSCFPSSRTGPTTRARFSFAGAGALVIARR